MSDAALVKLERAPKHLLATITCEKVGQREAQVIEGEIRGAAPGQAWRVLVDASNVGMLASMGLGMLVSLHKSAGEAGGRVVIFGFREELLGLLKVTHLDRVLKIVKTKEDALKLLP